MEALESMEGLSLKAPVPSAKADYSKSDSEILGIDDAAPALGDKGPIAKEAAESKPATEKGKWAEIDEDGNFKVPGEKAEAKPAVDEEEKPKVEAKEEEKPEQAEPLAAVAMSPALKELLANETIDSKMKQEIKNSFYGYQAFKEVFPTVQAARDIASLFPTVEDAKKAANSTEEFGEMIELFNGDPEQFVTRLAEEGKDEFARVARAVSKLHHQIDPESYGEIGRQNFKEYLGYWAEVAAEKGDENLQNAVDYLAFQAWGKKLGELSTGPDAKDLEIQRLKREQRQERSQEHVETIKAFNSDVDEAAASEVNKAVTSTIDRILGVKDIALSTDQKAEIIKQTFSLVRESLQKNSQLRTALREARDDGRFDEKHIQRCVGEITRRAALDIRKHAAEVVTHFTTKIITAADAAKTKQRLQEGRADVSGGHPSGSSGGAGKVTAEMIDYSRTSDADIMSDKFVARR